MSATLISRFLAGALIVGLWSAAILCSSEAAAQGSLQRSVRISNENGNIITLLSDTPTTSFSLFLPDSPNPSGTVPSLLYGAGNGKLSWSPTSGADSGMILQLTRVGGVLTPGWAAVATGGGSSNVNSNEPFLTFTNDNGSLTNNRVLTVGTGLSVTNTGVDNGSVILANTGVLGVIAGSGISVNDSNGYVTITNTGSSNGGGGLTGSGYATRVAFWGPGSGVVTSLQDDSSLYWDNINKRLSIGAGPSPSATLHTAASGSLTSSSTASLISNAATSSTNGIAKTGLSITTSGSWGSGSSSTSTNVGLDVSVTGATNTNNNIAALLNGGNVGIGVTNPQNLLHLRKTDAVTNSRSDVLTIDHNTSGTPAAGFGANLLYQLQTTAALAATGAMRDAASIGVQWSNATDANRSSAMIFSTVDSGSALTERMRIASNGYTGLNVSNPLVRLDIDGAYATRGKTLVLQNGRNDNIDVGDASYVRIVGPTAPFSISGICCGTNGKRVRLANITGQDWTVMDSSSYSSVANRIETNTGADIIVRGPVPVLDMIYDSNTSQWLLGTLNANQVIGAVGSLIYAVKTADEEVQNSATLQDDDHLFFNLNAGETWEINGEMQADNASNNIDWRIAFDAPSGTQIRIYFTGIQDAGGNAIQGNGLINALNSAKTVTISSAVSTLLTVRGIIQVGNTSGTLKFRWCQRVSNGSKTIVRQYSYLKILRIK